MNSNFTGEQIEAYASQFREGDAIWCGGEWNEVVKNQRFGDGRITAYVRMNPFVINDGKTEENEFDSYIGVTDGFKRGVTNKNAYRVTTLEHYKLQGGEKIVWLGENSSARTFGKVYTTSVGLILDEISVVCTDNHGWVTKPELNDWAIIPSYEQVKDLNKTTATEKVNQTAKETKRKQSIYEQVANEHNITKEELSFILDECDNGRKKYIIDCLIALRNDWHESN